MGVSMSEGLHDDGIQQGHVLSSSDRQLVCGVVVDDLGDGGEGRAVLAEHIAAICGLGELHVHEALTAPGGDAGRRRRKDASGSMRLNRTLRRSETDGASDRTFTTKTKTGGF